MNAPLWLKLVVEIAALAVLFYYGPYREARNADHREREIEETER